MQDGKLIVGQIGCGAFAEHQDFPNFSKHPQTQVKWACDINKARASQIAEEYGVSNVTDNFMDVVNDPEIDLIKVCTTHEAHLPIIEAAAAKGIHIFCEKPMAMEEEEAWKIISAIRKNNVKICVDLNRRMAPSMHALKKSWIDHKDNPAHQPWQYIEVDGGRPPFPEEAQTQFLVRVQDESSSYRIPHFDPMKGGGCIIGETVHWLDLACWLFAPQLPVEIVAWGSSRFSHGINLKFSEGDMATILFDCSGTFDFPKETYEICSNAALFRNLYFVENQYYGIPGKENEIFDYQVDGYPEAGTQGGFSGYMDKYRARVESTGGQPINRANLNPLNVDKGHSSMLAAFVDAILNDKPSPCDEIAGLSSTYLAKLAIQSIELRQALPVPVNRILPAI